MWSGECNVSCRGLSLDLLHSLLYFVVERAFVAWTYDAQVFLARALRRGDEWRECDGHWGYRSEVGPRLPGRNGFVSRGDSKGVCFKNPVVVYQL